MGKDYNLGFGDRIQLLLDYSVLIPSFFPYSFDHCSALLYKGAGNKFEGLQCIVRLFCAVAVDLEKPCQCKTYTEKL